MMRGLLNCKYMGTHGPIGCLSYELEVQCPIKLLQLGYLLGPAMAKFRTKSPYTFYYFKRCVLFNLLHSTNYPLITSKGPSPNVDGS